MSQYKKHTPSKTKGGSLFNSPLDILPGKYIVQIKAIEGDIAKVFHAGYIKHIKHAFSELDIIPIDVDVHIEVGMSAGVVIKVKGNKIVLLDYHSGHVHGEMEMSEVTGYLLLNQLTPSVPTIMSWSV